MSAPPLPVSAPLSRCLSVCIRSMVHSYRRQWLLPSQGRLPSHARRVTHHRSIRAPQGDRKGFLWQGHASTKEGHHARVCFEDNTKSPYCITTWRDHPYPGRENSVGVGEQPLHRASQVFLSESRQTLLGHVIWCVLSRNTMLEYISISL